MTATDHGRSAAPAERPVAASRGMTRRGWALFAAVGVIWGIPYALIEIADRKVSVPVLVFARVAVGAGLLLPVAVHRGRLGALWPRWRWVVALPRAPP